MTFKLLVNSKLESLSLFILNIFRSFFYLFFFPKKGDEYPNPGKGVIKV